MEYIIGFLIGLLAGAAVVYLVMRARSQAADEQMRQTFAALAGEALDANARRLTDAASSQLDGKKALIDQAVVSVNERLEQVRALLHRVESDRKQDMGQLSTSVASLAVTAGELHRMLASTQRRGAWGERMAEDVLRLAGLIEGVNYTKQSSADADTGRPDFTFLLPNDLKCNMDVKFPLAGYKAYVDARTDDARDAAMKQLVSDVRNHVRAVAARGYIDPKVPTVPYVVVFIASEQIYSLALSACPDLIDEALGRKVVLAGPLTLYAMLAVIRQAAENANVMKTADEILNVLAEFNKQWVNYNIELDKLGQRIQQAEQQFELVKTTRTNVLQRQIDKVENLRSARGLGD